MRSGSIALRTEGETDLFTPDSLRYNPNSTAASIVSGVLDATSAGILLWAGLVECLAHDFVFDRASK